MTSFTDDILTRIPDGLYCSRYATGIYFAIADRTDMERYLRNEYPDKIKIGQHCVDTRSEVSLTEQMDQRALGVSTGTGHYFNAANMYIPGKTRRHMDDIIRSRLIPAVTRFLDPLYDGPFMNADNRLKGEKGPRELGFHIKKQTVLVAFCLVYHRLYGMNYPSGFEDEFSGLLADDEVQYSLDMIQRISRDAVSRVPDSVKRLHYNVIKDTGFRDRSVYEEYFRMDVKPGEKIAVVSSSLTDMDELARMYPDNEVNLFRIIREDEDSGLSVLRGRPVIRVTKSVLSENESGFDAVLACIPSNGKRTMHTLSDIVLKLVNRETGKLSFIVDDSQAPYRCLWLMNTDVSTWRPGDTCPGSGTLLPNAG